MFKMKIKGVNNRGENNIGSTVTTFFKKHIDIISQVCCRKMKKITSINWENLTS